MIRNLVHRVFDLRPGDFRRGLPLVLYYFFIIAFYTLGRVSRDSIYQESFGKNTIPYADIAVAVLSSVLIAIYLRASRRANLRNLHVWTLVTFAAMLVLLWWGVHVEKSRSFVAAYYVWVGTCGILSISQVWMLANVLWTTRESKRLFGILGGGGIVGGSVGGFVGGAIAHAVGTDAVLLLMAAVALVCPVFVLMAWRTLRVQPVASPASAVPGSLRASARLVGRSPNLRAIATLVFLGSVVTSVAGWQYKVIAKAAIGETDQLTAFFGMVLGYLGIISGAIQLLLTSKLLRRFGVGLTLLILPLFLLVGSTALLVTGALWAATLLRGSDGVIRYSIDTSATQLLYLPVPANIKLQAKSFIDTVVWKFGDGVAGVTVLLFAATLGFTPREISLVTMILACGWIAAAVVARRQYVATLRETVQGVRLQPADVSVPTLDHSTTNVLAEKLASPDPEEVLYGLTLFEMGQRRQSHAAVRQLLSHPSPAVRSKAIAILNDSDDTSVRAQVTPLLADESLDVRTEALRYLTQHDRIDPLAQIQQLGEFPSAAVRSAAVAYLGRPGEGQNVDAAALILDGMVKDTGEAGRDARLEAARLIASLPDAFHDRLVPLLADADVAVVGEAIRTAGERRVRRVVPAMLETLRRPELRPDAIDALAAFSDGIVGTLRDHLTDPRETMPIREALAEILLRIGTPAAAAALGEALLEPDLTLRFRVLSALNKLQERRRDLLLDRQTIDAVMVAELMGHYRSYQLLGGLGGIPDEPLRRSMSHELERIFRLMKLLSPSLDLKEAFNAAHSSDAALHANALEFLDNTLSSEMRALIVPLIDSEVTTTERIKLADRFLGFSALVSGPAPTRPPRV